LASGCVWKFASSQVPLAQVAGDVVHLACNGDTRGPGSLTICVACCAWWLCVLLQLDKMVSHVNEILPVNFMGEDEYEDESEEDEVSHHRHDVNMS
jgi:hypothetical protein